MADLTGRPSRRSRSDRSRREVRSEPEIVVYEMFFGIFTITYDLNPQHLEFKSPSITTRSGILFKCSSVFLSIGWI